MTPHSVATTPGHYDGAARLDVSAGTELDVSHTRLTYRGDDGVGDRLRQVLVGDEPGHYEKGETQEAPVSGARTWRSAGARSPGDAPCAMAHMTPDTKAGSTTRG